MAVFPVDLSIKILAHISCWSSAPFLSLKRILYDYWRKWTSVPIYREIFIGHLSSGANHVFLASVETPNGLHNPSTLPISLQLNVQSWLIHTTTPKSSAFYSAFILNYMWNLFSEHSSRITGATCMLSLKTLLRYIFCRVLGTDAHISGYPLVNSHWNGCILMK